MSRNDLWWRLFAIGVSLLFHGLLLVQLSDRLEAVFAPPPAAPRVVLVRLDFPAPPSLEPVSRPERQPVRQPESEPSAGTKPKQEILPPPKPKAVPKPEPEPKTKPKFKPKPKPKVKLQQNQDQKPQPTQASKAAESSLAPTPAPAATSLQAATAATLSSALREQRESYLARLLARIEKEKRYPRAARRRGQQGAVDVSFSVTCNGEAAGLAITGSRRLLRNATRMAVGAATPLPVPPGDIACPMPVHFIMEFRLR